MKMSLMVNYSILRYVMATLYKNYTKYHRYLLIPIYNPYLAFSQYFIKKSLPVSLTCVSVVLLLLPAAIIHLDRQFNIYDQ